MEKIHFLEHCLILFKVSLLQDRIYNKSKLHLTKFKLLNN